LVHEARGGRGVREVHAGARQPWPGPHLRLEPAPGLLVAIGHGDGTVAVEQGAHHLPAERARAAGDDESEGHQRPLALRRASQVRSGAAWLLVGSPLGRQPGSMPPPGRGAPSKPAFWSTTFVNPACSSTPAARAERPPDLQPTTRRASRGNVFSITARKSGFGVIPPGPACAMGTL